MELLVCCVFAYWLVKHIPQLAGEAASEWQHARRGEESPAAAARRMRREAAGVDPASGGAFGQYAGNLWRDFWLDQDAARARHRADGGNPAGLGARLRRAFDREVERRAKAWRRRTGRAAPQAEESAGAEQDNPTSPDPSPAPGSESPGPAPTPDPPGDNDGQVPPAGQEPSPLPPLHYPSTVGSPIHDPAPGGTATAVLDSPRALTAPTERTPDMTQAVATNPTAVTGVVSGALEARAIQRYLEAATDTYEAAMAQARKRIHSLGEQTVSTVQMATRSTVVDATAQAAESIAAAQAGANRCRAETIPLLGQVAREFDKRNS